MCINILLFLLHKYVSKLDILRTRYLKNRRMKCIELALTTYMDSLLGVKKRMTTLPVLRRMLLDIKYVNVLCHVLWILILYQVELYHFEQEVRIERIEQSKAILENLKLAA